MLAERVGFNMSRRIVNVAKLSEFNWQQEAYQQIGQFVDVDCKNQLQQELPSGKYVIMVDKFEVYGRARQRKIGEIANQSDVSWLKQAVIADPKSPIIFRIHESDVPNEGVGSFFSLEVLTGPDARFYIKSEATEHWLEFGKEHWWKIGLGLVGAWWWFGL